MARYVVRVVVQKPPHAALILPRADEQFMLLLRGLEAARVVSILYDDSDHVTFDVQPPGSLAVNDVGAERAWAIDAAHEMELQNFNAVPAPWSPKS